MSCEQSSSSDTPKIPRLQNILTNEETRNKFCGLLEECLVSLTDVFPECSETAALLEKYNDIIKGSALLEDKLVKKWHNSMKPFYSMADAHDDTLWDQNLPFFHDIDIGRKWRDPEFTEESKDYLWEYLDGLNKHSRIYNAIPEHMLNTIQDAASGMAESVRNGEMKFDLESLNWKEIESMGKNVMAGLEEKDIEEFVSNISGLAQGMNLNGPEDIPRVLNDIPGMSDILSNAPNFGDLLNQIFQTGDSQGGMEEQMQRIQEYMPPELKSQMEQMQNDQMPSDMQGVFENLSKMMGGKNDQT